MFVKLDTWPNQTKTFQLITHELIIHREVLLNLTRVTFSQKIFVCLSKRICNIFVLICKTFSLGYLYFKTLCSSQLFADKARSLPLAWDFKRDSVRVGSKALPTIVRVRWKLLQRVNIYDHKKVLQQRSGGLYYKCFTIVIYHCKLFFSLECNLLS